MMKPNNFPVEIGQKILKSDLHKLVGGSDQHGMTSCSNGSAFLVFHNPQSGKPFGYDKWEGWQSDGTFHYTGQGANGDQKFAGPNKTLLRMGERGLPIHLFHTEQKGSPYTYFGLMGLGNPEYEVSRALGKDGVERDVIVFHLVPIGASGVEAVQKIDGEIAVSISTWTPPKAMVAFPGVQKKPVTQIELEEMRLQARFGQFLIEMGENVKAINISLERAKGVLHPDIFIESRQLVIEAKPSTSREHVRLAIGQVLDYVHLLEKSGQSLRAGILLPARPQDDLCELLHKLQIELIYETHNGEFIFATNNLD